MHIEDFNFTLPKTLIAQYPLPNRRDSRLMCLAANRPLAHQTFANIIDFIEPGDLLIFNDTRVIPARLYGHKLTGGKVELLVERVLDTKRMIAQLHVSKPPKVGDLLSFPGAVMLRIDARSGQFYELTLLDHAQTILEIIETMGEIPLPHYMQRAVTHLDKERYQTIYAKFKGSVAAPTAGLHFDQSLMEQLQQKGVQLGYLTLHIGAGTFIPVRSENITDHQMHKEQFSLSPELCEQIARAKAAGKRVIAVGTTSLRALESAAKDGQMLPFSGETSIFIYPGYVFQIVDALITNFHLPKSTLLMLVAAFGGHQRMLSAYEVAVNEGYRFYSYGDAMWVEREKNC